MHKHKNILFPFLLALNVAIQGCSSLLPKTEFVPADPEALNEWSMEGELVLQDPSNKQKTWFEYRSINGEYQLKLRPDSPVGAAKAILSGVEGDTAVQVDVRDPARRELASTVQQTLPMENLGYWLRTLPTNGSAEIKNGKKGVESIKEAGWEIEFDQHFMEIGSYRLPEKMTLSHGKTLVELSMVRAETGFIINPCSAKFDVKPTTLSAVDAASDPSYGSTIRDLVPPSGNAPLPRWIDDGAFCKQLYKVHGDIPDPRIGLFGPDSIMWRVTGRLTPAAMGAGRALLLQTAHPWVTASVDDHSIVRYDPLVRAQRTFIYITTLVFGSMPQALSAANTVHGIHNAIQGEMPYDAGAFKEGTRYSANEVSAMIWVSSTLWDTLVRMYEVYEDPLTDAEKDKFYEEIKLFNMMFGIPESAMPRNWNEYVDYIETMWYSPQLTVTNNARILKEDLFNQGSLLLAFPLWVQEVVTAKNLPGPIRDQYGMETGLWTNLNYYGWIMPGSKFFNWVMPDSVAKHAVYHEAEARLRGKRVGWYHRNLVKTTGLQRLVN